MNRFSTWMKAGLAALFIASVPLTSSAEHVRVLASTGTSTSRQHNSATPQQVATFLKFFQSRRDNANKLGQTPSAGSFNVTMPSRSKTIFKSPADPVGHLMALVPSHSEGATYADAYLGTLDPLSLTLEKKFKGEVFSNGEDYYWETGAVRNGVLYIPAYTQDMITQEVTIYWKAFDTETGQELARINFGSSTEALSAFLYGMTYDSVNDLFYGLSLSFYTGTGGTLVVIDPKQATWKAETLADVGSQEGDFMSCIAFNPVDKMIYGLKDSGTLYMIDTQTDPQFPQTIELRQYDDFSEYYCYPEYQAANAFCYSPYDHAFAFVYRDAFEEKMKFVTIDAESYDAYELGEINPLGYISMLASSDPYAEDDAPDRTSAPEVRFDGASLSGTYTVTLPTTTFIGVALSQNITLKALVDGVEVDSYSATPGETVTRDLTTTNGEHSFEVYAEIGELAGPKQKVFFYAGHDNPLAPTNLSVDGTHLSWDAPGSKGQHNGYVDTEALTYDVYFNGIKQNLQPVTRTLFRFANPEEMERKSITVTATANEMTSKPSVPLSRAIGEALSLPFSMQPATEEEASLFETYNADGDDNVFEYYTGWDGYNCFTIRTYPYYAMPDDWLFMPPVHIEDINVLYEVACKYANSYLNELHCDNLEIWIGSAQQPDKMTRMIYSHNGRKTPEPTDLTARFAVEEDGDYVIGFHSKPGNSTQYRGIQLYDFKIGEAVGASSKVPGEPTGVGLAPDANGELYITATMTLPTVDILNRPLDADKDVTAIVKSGGTATVTGKPGETVSVTVEASDDGMNDVLISCSSAEGEGLANYYSLYVGLDTPLAPTNVNWVVDEDNLGLVLTWDAPTGGVNGGYVNFDEIDYNIYSHGSAGNYTKVGKADGMTYHFTIQPQNQSTYQVGPVAENRMGRSTNGLFAYEPLGTPYATPMVEGWASAGFSYSKWYFDTDGDCAGSTVTSVPNAYGLGIDDPTLEDSGALIIGAVASTRYRLYAPKFTTADIDKPQVSIRLWDYRNMGTVELWGRTAQHQDYTLIATYDANRGMSRWADWVVNLPSDFSHQSWVQVNVCGSLEPDQYVLLDNYKGIQDIENDFSLQTIDGPAMTTIGETPTFITTIANSGSEPNSTRLLVELLGDGEQLASEVVEVGRTLSGEQFTRNTTFEMVVEYMGHTKYEVRSSIIGDNDENASNNVKSIEFVLNEHTLPVVRDLNGHRDGLNAVLEWSTPDCEYGSPESFEAIEPMVIKENLGLWTSVDLDGLPPFAIDQSLRFDNDDSPCAWIVWDAKAMGTTNDERLSAHTGTQCVMARSIGYDQNTDLPTKSFDWLISPEIVPGTEVSFWYNTISSSYTETVEVWVSKTDTRLDPDNIEYDANDNPIKCGSFVKLRNFTKSGSEAWEFCKITPLELTDVKYVAFVYGSIGQFGALLDDITFTPANTYTWDIDSYDIIRSRDYTAKELVATGVKDLKYVEENDARNTNYWVRSVVVVDGKEFRSPLSNVFYIDGTSVDTLEAGAYVTGSKGSVTLGNLTGKTVEIYDADGRHIDTVNVTSDRQSAPAPAGVVIVKADNVYHKVMVK